MTPEEHRDSDIREAIRYMDVKILTRSETEERLIGICKRYAKLKCDQQRVLCYKETGLVIDDVLNAPTPEFE